MFGGAAALFCVGCQRSAHKPLPEEDIHSITREFVYAANSVAPPGAVVHGEVGAFDKVTNSSDLVEIHLPEKRQGNSYPPAVRLMMEKFDAIAAVRGLTRDPQAESGDTVFIHFRHNGTLTHTIHIHLGGTDET